MMYYALFAILGLVALIGYLAYRSGYKSGHINGYDEGYDQSATDLAAINSYFGIP